MCPRSAEVPYFAALTQSRMRQLFLCPHPCAGCARSQGTVLKARPLLPCRSAPPCCASQQAPAHRQHLQHPGGPLQCFQRSCCRLTCQLCHAQKGVLVSQCCIASRRLADTVKLVANSMRCFQPAQHSVVRLLWAASAIATLHLAPHCSAAEPSAAPDSVLCCSEVYMTGHSAASASRSPAPLLQVVQSLCEPLLCMPR